MVTRARNFGKFDGSFLRKNTGKYGRWEWVYRFDIITDINFKYSETALGYVNYASAAWDLEACPATTSLVCKK